EYKIMAEGYFEAARIIAIPFSRFIPIISDVVSVIEELTTLCQSAEHNKRIGLALVDRVAAVETAIRQIKSHKDDNREFFNQQNFVAMQRLLNNIQKMRKFVIEVTQLKWLSKYIQAKSIKTTFDELTEEFDSLVNVLNFTISVDTKIRAEKESKMLQNEIKDLTEYLEEIGGGITDINNNVSEAVTQINAVNGMMEKLTEKQEMIDSIFQDKPLKLVEFKETKEQTRGKKVKKYIRLMDSEEVSFKL
ncbi:5196_t:CDS:2, partial [Scutellospora calospora]